VKYCKTLITSAALAAAALTSSSAIATQQGDWLVRARIINIAPNVSSGNITAMDGSSLAPTVPDGATIDVDSATTLDIDISYFFTNNIAVELLLDFPASHDITGDGSINGIGKIGEVAPLPPALIAQYHFMPQNNIRPYAGAGIGYVFFLSEETTDTLTGVVPGANSSGLDVDDTFYTVIQAGVDFDINKDWYWNLDAKYMFINSTAVVQFDGQDTAKVDFDLDPLVLGVGIGTRF
jgi:outer membrane protein